ncbi:putative bifurcating oxidoreductase, gamma subunit [Candidatus Syntrophocurvum alkaliphilum]|uniref:Putative bifurcating oxidoreductase, gamma subunit n=1 Tax=Candidatus Syntrophocurvum alkaliphilum TaxID=2293317 RepID=A0A6I6DHB6_9FIRM|nr:NADH-quinone oxidoreductase subunit NuoE [Candidatus Syntrophocurvum alkaliphilum]QGT99019.1 putative bifurcating oxidoreductase, gamma subunit [Candidatus Syntrophocurvum alkaliphilum]
MNCSCGEERNNIDTEKIDLSLIDTIINQYKGDKGNLITVLQKTQDIYGYLPVSSLNYIAKGLGIKRSKVFGVATFYTQFRLTPMGKYVILLCQGTACHVNGSEQIETALCQELKIKTEETTEDGLFTLSNAACLGCCSLAPVMMINGQAYGPLTPDKAVSVVREIYAKEKVSTGEGEKS